MRQQGKLGSWNDEKGFGFITPISGGAQVFVHISSFGRGTRRPALNESISYIVSRDRQNRLRAENVRFQRTAKRKVARRRGLLPALCLLIGFFTFLTGLAIAGLMPFPVIGFYALMSVVSFLMYALDKSAAQRGAWRTAESTLHLTELAGGWPGALLAQHMFRHKTNKKPFQFAYWLAVVANCAALSWLLQSEAAAGVRAGLGIG